MKSKVDDRRLINRSDDDEQCHDMRIVELTRVGGQDISDSLLNFSVDYNFLIQN